MTNPCPWILYRRTLISALVPVLALITTGSLMAMASPNATSVTIVNNASREIRHVYLSHTNEDNWGADQIDPSTIPSGSSVTLNNVACSAADLKVIAEDQDGCFIYKVISCGQSTTWTITNESARDCGN